MLHLSRSDNLTLLHLDELGGEGSGNVVRDVVEQKHTPVLPGQRVKLLVEKTVSNVGVEPAGEEWAVGLQYRELGVLVVLALALRHRAAERFGDSRRHTGQVVVVTGSSQHTTVNPVVAVLCARLSVMRDESVTLPDALQQQFQRIRRRRQRQRVNAWLSQFLVGIPEDDRNLKVVLGARR